jgi:DNA-directed RNA polymerase specialized sigma24 family protein
MKTRTKTKHKVNPVTPRLSDEELDPLEKDDNEGVSTELVEGHLPWTPEDIADIKRVIDAMLPSKPQEVLQAFLEGLNHQDIDVSEKYWRYHFAKGVELIRKELKL